MNPAIRSAALRYRAAKRAFEAEPHGRETVGGGAASSVEKATLGQRRHAALVALGEACLSELARVEAAPESAPAPTCGSCGAPRAIDGCAICDAGRLTK